MGLFFFFFSFILFFFIFKSPNKNIEVLNNLE